MTPLQAAAEMNGAQYGNEDRGTDLWERLKESGLVAVFGYSDDVVEIRGAWGDDEFGACDVLVTRAGVPVSECEEGADCPYFKQTLKGATALKVSFGPDGWSFQTTIPHETFQIFDDGELYCTGIVFRVEDVPA